MKTFFLIPARGGSKGFPGKNVAALAGIPLVGWAARLACQAAGSHSGSRVVCSTDDTAIAKAAAAWGAEVPFVRPAQLATDDAKTLDVVIHALDVSGGDYEAVAVLQPTSPLTELEDVLGALRLFEETGCPVVGARQERHPAEWCFHMDHDGRVQGTTESLALRRQQTQPSYRPDGSVYVASVAQTRAGGFWGSETRGFVIPGDSSVDIDLPSDLALAEALLAGRPVPIVEIAGSRIGRGHPCFVIAEAGVNHNGNLDMALRLVDVAAEAGVDAVKFQTFKAERVVSPTAPKAAYQRANTGLSDGQLEMLRQLELTDSQHREIQRRCREREVLFLSSPFDEESVDLLVSMGVPALKIGSGEITNHGFLRYLAKQNLPLLMSTGMSSMLEVDKALAVLRRDGADSVALLHCVSNYPATPSDCSLPAIDEMRKAFCLQTGWSDHTLGSSVSLAAVARGATIIEKHLTLDRSLPGPDHAASAEPGELRALVQGIREVELSISAAAKGLCASELNTAAVSRRSIHAARTIPAGHRITREDVVMLRPGTGIPADRADEVIGRVVSRSIPAGHALSEECLL
jgi:N,N'-diacetyllegionaminate synthase